MLHVDGTEELMSAGPPPVAAYICSTCIDEEIGFRLDHDGIALSAGNPLANVAGVGLGKVDIRVFRIPPNAPVVNELRDSGGGLVVGTCNEEIPQATEVM